MASVKVYKADGTAGQSTKLNDAIFDVEPNMGLVHQVAVALMNNRRQGNAETRTRKDVRGGGRKPFAQKPSNPQNETRAAPSGVLWKS